MLPAGSGVGGIPRKWGCGKIMETVRMRPIQKLPDEVAAKDNAVAPTGLGQVDVCEGYLQF